MSRGKIDNVDRSILEHLSRDGRRSNREIAQELNLGEGTVRGRVKRMQEEGIIKIMALTSYTEPTSPQPRVHRHSRRPETGGGDRPGDRKAGFRAFCSIHDGAL